MKTVKIEFNTEYKAVHVGENIFGANLEVTAGVVTHLTSNRLKNPKFTGQATESTGLAGGWHLSCKNDPTMSCSLLYGEGIMGSNAQAVNILDDAGGYSSIQQECWIEKGETIELCIWARFIHNPCKIKLTLKAKNGLRGNVQPYCEKEIDIDSHCWKEYKSVFKVNNSDDEAVLAITVLGRSYVCFDQISMHPHGTNALNTKVFDAIASMNLPVLRFPGGCVTTAYHWKFGTGEQFKRPVLPDPVFRREYGCIDYSFGTDEYLGFCCKNNISPHITVNIATSYPGESESWAGYCFQWFKQRNIEAPLIYWHIGNEPYGNWERAHTTPELYADMVNAIAPEIRRAYSHSKIVIVGQPQYIRFPQSGYDQWSNTVLRLCSANADIISCQLYGFSESEDLYTGILMNLNTRLQRLEQLVRDAQKYGVGLALSEWNLWLRNGPEKRDMLRIIFMALSYHCFAGLAPNLEIANYYNTISDKWGLIDIDKNNVSKNVIFDIFSFYRKEFPAKRMKVSFPGDKFADIDVLAIKNHRGQNVLFIVNKNRRKDITVELPREFNNQQVQGYRAASPYDSPSETHTVVKDMELFCPALSINKIISGAKK